MECKNPFSLCYTKPQLLHCVGVGSKEKKTRTSLYWTGWGSSPLILCWFSSEDLWSLMACWGVGTQILFFPRAHAYVDSSAEQPYFPLCTGGCQLGFSLTTLFLFHKALPIVCSDSLFQCTWTVQTHAFSESNGRSPPPPPPLLSLAEELSWWPNTMVWGPTVLPSKMFRVSSSFPFSSLLLTWTWGCGKVKRRILITLWAILLCIIGEGAFSDP